MTDETADDWLNNQAPYPKAAEDGPDHVRKTFEQAKEITPADPDELSTLPRTPDDGNSSDPPHIPPDDPGPHPDDPGSPADDPHDPIMQAANLPLNDYGNGQRFKIHFGEDVIYVPRVSWFTWSGMVWEKDPDNLAVRRKAQKIAALIEAETKFIEPSGKEKAMIAEEGRLLKRFEDLQALTEADQGDDHKEEVGTIQARLKTIEATLKTHKSLIGRRLTHARNAGNNGPLGHMLTESQTDLVVPYENLDAGKLDINTESGVLRFTVTDTPDERVKKKAEMVLVPHARDQLLSKLMPLTFDREAKAPLFDAFLARIQPDIEMRQFLQRWFGLSMTAIPEQKLAFFYGSGANGKSVLVDLMGKAMGNYAATARIESLTGTNRRGGGDATPDLVPLMGGRMVRATEPDEGQRLQEALIKELTGGEPMLIRSLNKDFIEVLPFFKLTMSGNHKPDIRGTDDGIWRRVMLVPFDIQIPESERDPDLGKKLWEERAGIMNWLIEGLLEYLEYGLEPPQGVLEATREYREESDPIGAFLTRCCVISGDHHDTVLSKELGEAFNFHLMERGYSSWKPTTFARQVSTKSKQWRHPETGRQFTKGKASISQYIGIMFTDAFNKRFRDAPRDHNGRIISAAPAVAPSDASTPHPDIDDFRE